MSEIVNRVARAKWAHRQEVARMFGIKPPLADWSEELETLREEVRAETRAVIAAMREPTDEIIFVLDEALHGDPGHNEMPTGKRLKDTVSWWQAMIDAALK